MEIANQDYQTKPEKQIQLQSEFWTPEIWKHPKQNPAAVTEGSKPSIK